MSQQLTVKNIKPSISRLFPKIKSFSNRDENTDRPAINDYYNSEP